MYNITIQKTSSSKLEKTDFENLVFGKQFSDHMFEVDYIDGEWRNPRISPLHMLELHPANLSLHYGQLIFEGMKATKSIGGEPVLFRPEMHAKRLNASAARLSMVELPEDLFVEAVRQFVRVEADWIPPKEGSALYLRPFMMAMDSAIGVSPSNSYKFMIIACPVGPYYPKPVKLYAQKEYVRAVVGGTGEAKAAGNYSASLLPASEARSKGFDQILWLDGKEFKYLQEVGTMNIFFVIGDKVITPYTDGAILKGITRDSIIQILKKNGYTVEERLISIDELYEANAQGTLKEVFGTGTAAVISYVDQIHFEGKDIYLDPETFTVASLAKDQLNGIRSGRIKDEFNWTEII